jgi:hypothetical protein
VSIDLLTASRIWIRYPVRYRKTALWLRVVVKVTDVESWEEQDVHECGSDWS